MPNPIRVLIVEDSADDAELMLRDLGDHGFAPHADRVETEAAYLSGLDAAPDVILADYRLPQFSGLRALELLNERRLDIPFIVVSGDIGDEEAAGLIKLGASDFLLKDRIARLGTAVTQALKLKRARDEQRQIEAALVKSEQRFRTLSENSSDLTIVIDRSDMITYISPSLKRIGGYEISDALDKNFLGFIHREDVSAATTNLAAVVQNPDELRVVELRSRHKNGNWLTFETILRNALDEPIIGGIVVNARDITERKNQEQKIVRLSRIHVVMSAVNSLIVRESDRQKLFSESCRIAVEQGGFGLAWIGVLNEKTRDITPAAWAGIDAESFVAHGQDTDRPDTSLSENLANCAITEKRAVFSNDLTREPGGGARRKEAIRRGYRSAVSLPLLLDGAAVGNLSLFAKDTNFFDADEVRLLTELTGDISFALNHIAKEEKITRLSRIEAVMSGVSSLIMRVSDRQELFDGACRIAVEQGKLVMAWIGLLDSATRGVTPVAKAGRDDGYLEQINLTLRNDVTGYRSLTAEALTRAVPVVCNDISVDERLSWRRDEALKRGYRSVAFFPLQIEQRPIGIFVLYAPEPRAFDEQEMKLLNELADNISFALQAIARQEKLDKLSRIRAVSSEINTAIVRIRERETLLRETCRIAAEHGKFELVWVASVDIEKQDVRPVAWVGFSPDAARSVNWRAINAARRMLGEAIQTRRAAVNNDIDAGVPGGVLREEAIRKGCLSAVCMPLVADDKVVALCALFAAGRGFFDTDELSLLKELAADVSFALEYIAKEEKLNYLAYYDVLTGLPNRALFDDRMTQVLRAASHEKEKVALVLIDLERFRAINDTLGRSVADELLKLVAQRLQSVIFDRDSLARVHADVFAGLFSDIKDEPDIARIVEEKIIGCLNQPFTIAGQELRVTAKAGVALFPGDATEPDVLFSSAEAALRQAKGSSDRYLFYAPKMNAMVAERLKLENKLQRALERDEFVLFYQPKVDLDTGRVAGLEALIRWNDPDTGLVMPMRFIPLLEETGMIVEVGAWAMKQAVSQYGAWQAAGIEPPPIAVNVSAVQLKRKDFVTSVQQAIAVAGKPDHGLDLEITESMIMEDIESSIEKLKLIRTLGVGISIDDFGTGYSSLRYLTRLPITALKIDHAFVQYMTTNPDNMAIVSAVITLGHNLNLKVIAEGVETEEQRKYLQLLKCDEFQGYLFSKPVPAEQVPALLTRGEKKAVTNGVAT